MQDTLNENPSVEISVLMCVYNGDVFLVEAIESILAQSFSAFEFVIVDDASSDQTARILKRYADLDSRIRIITNEKNLGLTESLNIGLAACRGKYIARMDADDVAIPERFMSQYWFMEEHPTLAVLGSFVQIIDEKGKVLGERKLAVTYEHIKERMLFNNQFIHSTLFFRSDILKENGGYDEKFRKSQDYELMFRLGAKYPVANLPEKLLKLRFHQGSLSWTSTDQQTYGIRARILAITRYGFPLWSGILNIVIRALWLLLPKKFKIRYHQSKMKRELNPV